MYSIQPGFVISDKQSRGIELYYELILNKNN